MKLLEKKTCRLFWNSSLTSSLENSHRIKSSRMEPKEPFVLKAPQSFEGNLYVTSYSNTISYTDGTSSLRRL